MSSVRVSPLVRSAAVLACGVVATSGVLLAGSGAAGAAPAPKVPVVGGTFKPALPAGVATPSAVEPGADITLGLERGQEIDRVGTDSDNANGIVSVGLPPAGSSDPYTGGGTTLVLQSDGNLVEYETTTDAVLFSSNTTTGSRLVYQEDGNVVLYDDADVPLFQTGTAGDTVGEVFAAYGNGQLVIEGADSGPVVPVFGNPVTPGPGVVNAVAYSPNGAFSLVVQDDGNVVAYRNDIQDAFFSTQTFGQGPVRFAAQSDGNLVVYSATTGKALWQSGSAGAGQAYYQLDMQDDGNIVLYRTDGKDRLNPVWASYTYQDPGTTNDRTGK